MTRRTLLATTLAAPELAFAQHAAISGPVPPGTIWLNANESPEGPPAAARAALLAAVDEAGRYSHRAFPGIEQAIAAALGVAPDQLLLGAGSSQVLHCALQAFTGPGRSFITAWPTWEMTAEIAGRLGAPVVKVPLTKTWAADVEQMADRARRAGGGLVHLGNPNNPTSSLTPPEAVAWLAANLPSKAVLLVDEAYIDYVEDARGHSALPLVQQGKRVVVTRTFSKLFGLAGARIGLGCAPAELIAEMRGFRENVVSILGARAAAAALGLGPAFVNQRRTERLRVRAEFCAWLKGKGIEFVPPAANFVLLSLGRPVIPVIQALLERGVAPGRRFDSLDQWLRIAIGTAAEMQKVQAVLPQALA